MDENVDIKKFFIYIFYLLKLEKEIYDYNNNEVDALVSLLCEEVTLSAGKRFSDFLFKMKQSHQTAYTSDFVLESRNIESKTKEAYSSDTFLRLVYYLYNQEYIDENLMIEKACESWYTANTWLYLAIHMISAIRDTDLEQLPHPRLSKSPKEIIEAIKSGSYSDAEARLVIQSIHRQLLYFSHAPNKTLKYSGISDIKLIIPESATVLLGKLFALVESHILLSEKGGCNNYPSKRL